MMARRSSRNFVAPADTSLRFFIHTLLYMSMTAERMSSALLPDTSLYERSRMVDFLSPISTDSPPRKRPVAEALSLLRTSISSLSATALG